MQIIKEILGDLEHDTVEAQVNEYVSETALYEFILKKIDYKGIDETLSYYFMKLASASIASELIRQGEYGTPFLNLKDTIFDLLVDRDDKEYLSLYQFYIEKISFLEYHRINNENYFLGEDLKIKYDSLIKIFASIISEELYTALEKVRKILLNKVSLGEWHRYIFAGSGATPEGYKKEFVESIVYGVLK